MAQSPKSGLALVIKISSEKIQEEEIRLISNILRQGAVIAYPTDTFYGLGANVFSRQALERIHRIKKRQASKPMPVLVSDLEMAKSLIAEIPSLFGPSTEKFWPGPLTLVIKAAAGLPAELVGAKRTIGIRLPNVTWLRDLIHRAGFPIVATSANISGAGEIDSAEEVIRQFKEKVDLIADAGRTPGGRPSTVLDLTGKRPVILREGAIPKAEIQRLLF
jgi:L-threonylcarbamoyladenylate synthase